MRLVYRGPDRDPADALREGEERGVLLASEHLLAVSRSLVPIEEGTLERSGTASQDGVRAAVSYDTPYAVRQHEDLTLGHDAGRQAKYLEQPMNSERGTLAALIAQAVRERLQ